MPTNKKVHNMRWSYARHATPQVILQQYIVPLYRRRGREPLISQHPLLPSPRTRNAALKRSNPDGPSTYHPATKSGRPTLPSAPILSWRGRRGREPPISQHTLFPSPRTRNAALKRSNPDGPNTYHPATKSGRPTLPSAPILSWRGRRGREPPISQHPLFPSPRTRNAALKRSTPDGPSTYHPATKSERPTLPSPPILS